MEKHSNVHSVNKGHKKRLPYGQPCKNHYLIWSLLHIFLKLFVIYIEFCFLDIICFC